MFINPNEVKDKRQKRWEAKTFMEMIGAMLFNNKLAAKGLRTKMTIAMPGFPLRIATPSERSPEVKARKKLIRQQRRARYNRRGF